MDYYEVEPSFDEIPDYEIYEPSGAEMWAACVWPSLQQILSYSLPFVCWISAFRITSQTEFMRIFHWFHNSTPLDFCRFDVAWCGQFCPVPWFDSMRRNSLQHSQFTSTVAIPQTFQHISSIICGLALAYSTLGIDFMYSLCFTTIEYIVLLAIPFFKIRKYGIILTVFCLAALITGEVMDTAVITWQRMRGTQMIAAVKIISIGFDIDRKKIRYPPNFVEFWGYVLCPGNVIMGPWCAYNDYMNLFNRTNWSFIWIFQVLLNYFIAIFFLLSSNCFIEAYVPDLYSAWGAAYKGALSFRCSNYFICFLSHSTALLAGLVSVRNQKHDRILGYSITKPWAIELPRSLVDVVVYWNLSMHYWLKTYVFLQLKPLGIFSAIIFTYIISSLLHGVSVHLSAVLLSLGFATFAEYTIRKKIADIFDACVLANACTECSHRYNGRNLYVIAFNLAFRILAMVHLAYLGILLDGADAHSEFKSSFKHIQDRWGNLDYLSHWIILFTFCLGILI